MKPFIAPFSKKKCAYYIHSGDYSHSWDYFMKFLSNVNELYDTDLTMCTGFGIYYDDPHEKPMNEWRSIIGIFLPDGIEKREDSQKGILFGIIKRMENTVQVEYPFNSKLCIPFAQIKAYPALTQYIKANHLKQNPTIDVYDGKTITVVCGIDEVGGLLYNCPFS